ncbi:ATP synthase F(0) complex subunit C1, mitochondrial [Lemmus lemmus]
MQITKALLITPVLIRSCTRGLNRPVSASLLSRPEAPSTQPFCSSPPPPGGQTGFPDQYCFPGHRHSCQVCWCWGCYSWCSWLQGCHWNSVCSLIIGYARDLSLKQQLLS